MLEKSSDEKIKQILKSEINIPDGYIDAINTAFSKKKKNNYFVKVLAATCSGIILTGGIAFAGYTIYEKVWKEPERVSNSDVEQLLEDKEISKEDENMLISNEEAEEKVLSILNNLGYKELKVENIETKNTNNMIYFNIKVIGDNNFIVSIDGKTGNLIGLQNLNNNYENIEQISEDEAREFSVYTSKSLNLNNEDYELKYCKEENGSFSEKQYKVWVSNFNRKYDDRYNPYDSMQIQFYKENNKFQVISITINRDYSFENNEIKINKEEAEKIALEKEKQLSQTEIEDIASELGIRKMNTYIFRLENNIDIANIDESNNDTVIYKTENITRNVWIVTIKHKKKENMTFDTNLEYSKQMDKEYYVDAATGEIIGGVDYFEESNNALYN